MQKRLSVFFDGWFVKRLEAPVVLDLDSPSVFKCGLFLCILSNEYMLACILHPRKAGQEHFLSRLLLSSLLDRQLVRREA